MATITFKTVREYFSTLNRRSKTPDIVYLDEIAICPTWLSDKDSRKLWNTIVKNCVRYTEFPKLNVNWSLVR